MKRSLRLEITAIILLLVLIILGSYVVFIKAPTTLITNSYTISDSAIPHEFNDFKIGLFSDTCIRNENDIQLLEEAVEKLNKGNFDLVLFGGDLFYSNIYEQEKVQELLSSVKAKYGKFAVLGEKDLATNIDTTNILNASGFEVLKDKAIPIYYGNASIVLTGLESEVNIDSITGEKYNGYYKLCLVHQPDTYKMSFREDYSNGINLQLSGHSHGGYVYLPFLDITQKRNGANTYVHGEYETKSGHIIITNGVNSEPDVSMRLFCSPDIVSIKFRS